MWSCLLTTSCHSPVARPKKEPSSPYYLPYGHRSGSFKMLGMSLQISWVDNGLQLFISSHDQVTLLKERWVFLLRYISFWWARLLHLDHSSTDMILLLWPKVSPPTPRLIYSQELTNPDCSSLVVSSGSFLSYFSPTTTEIGLVASLLTAGAFVGAGLAYPCSDYFGRRATILAGGLIFCLGGSLQAGARNYGYILESRFIAGVS